MSALRIAVSGYYGCGNTGDEAVLAGIVESFRIRAPEQRAEFTVLSADPADTGRRHGLKAIHRMDRRAISAAFRRSDLVISGGGSLLQDTTSLRSLLYYLWVVRTAQRRRVPVMFYAQGIGPLRRALSRRLTAWVADRVQRITVRDPESAQTLRAIGVQRPPIEVTADPAFALDPAPDDSIEEILRTAGVLPGERLIGVALRPWPGADREQLAEAMAAISARTGRRMLLLAMQRPGDADLSRAVSAAIGDKALVLDRPLSPAEAIGITERLDLLIGMRLHALIFAVAAGVPVVGIAYDPKVDQLLEIAGQSSRRLALGNLAPDIVAAAADDALNEAELLRSERLERAARLRERAFSNVDHALLAIGTTL